MLLPSAAPHHAELGLVTKVAIMQPYFLPYIGYFQLIDSVDQFIVYDNIKYTKKGWINRNRILRDGEAETLTIPLKGASDALDIRDRAVAADFPRLKLLNQVSSAYGKAPQFDFVYPVFQEIVEFEAPNLFQFVSHSLRVTCRYLKISTPIVISSSVEADHALKGQDRVLAICRAVNATHYVNASGGIDLYSSDAFERLGIALQFLQPALVEYRQFRSPFVPWLSILDVAMFNSVATIREAILPGFSLAAGATAKHEGG